MFTKKNKILILSFVAITFILGIFFYPMMPEKVASHWNSQGEVDGYMTKFWGVFILPFILLFCAILLLVIPKMDPRFDNIKKIEKPFSQFIYALILFFVYLYSLTIWWNLGGNFNMLAYLIPAFSILFIFMGRLVGKAEMNYSVGIRTPWALANEEVWKKTHQFGEKVFYLFSLLLLSSLLFLSQAFIIFILLILSFFIIYGYSYFLFRKISNKKPSE